MNGGSSKTFLPAVQGCSNGAFWPGSPGVLTGTIGSGARAVLSFTGELFCLVCWDFSGSGEDHSVTAAMFKYMNCQNLTFLVLTKIPETS